MASEASRISQAKPEKHENGAGALNLRIKRVLNDVIDVAYAKN